jgi:integrase
MSAETKLKNPRPSQQDIRLNLPAELGSLKAAQQKVKRIAGELASGSFEWYDYLPATQVAKLKAEAEKRSNPRSDWKVIDLVEAFTERYFQKHKRTATTEQSFKIHYLDYFKKLPQHVPLTVEVIEDAILTKTEADSYTRQQACFVFKTLAKLIGLDTASIHELRGSYCATKPAPRDLPSDELIVEWFDRIPNPNWQWVFGIIATYGLRPHETFHVDSSELEQGGYAIYVLDNTKTGRRRVMPLRTQWIERFRLREKRLPKITGKTNQAIGQRISKALRRDYKIPFPPYNLRHAYAVRWVLIPNIKDSMVARWMGHSLAIHTKVYQAWLSEADERKAFEQHVLGTTG